MQAVTKSESLMFAAIAGIAISIAAVVTGNWLDVRFFHEGWLDAARATLLSDESTSIGRGFIYTIIGFFVAGFGVTFYLAESSRSDQTHGSGTELGDINTIKKGEAAGIKATGEGIHVGKAVISRRREAGHFLVLGLPGSGKTVLLNSFLKEILDERSGDKIVIHDPKGDFTQWVDDPIIYAPWDKRSAKWLIGTDIDTQALAREAAAAWIPEPKSGDSQWTEGAGQILAGLLFYLQDQKGRNWGFSDLSDLIGGSQKSICKYAVEGWPAVSGLVASDEKGNLTKTTQSYLSTMLAPLSWIHQVAASEKNAVESVSFRDFAITESPSRRVLIFKNDSRFAKSAEVLFALTLKILAQNLCSPMVRERKGDGNGTWFFLDEFPQLAKSAGQSVQMIQEVGRSKGARVIVAAQDISQFIGRYGREEGETMTRLQQTVIYARLSSESAYDISNNSPKKTVFRRSKSISESGNNSDSMSQVDVPVLTPDDLTGLRITESGPEFIVMVESKPSRITVQFPSIENVRQAAEDNVDFMTITRKSVAESESLFGDSKEEKTSPSALSEVEPMSFDDVDGMDFDEGVGR